MKAAELRKSILQAAVQGKLVPQNTHDEPASELLERIQKEKARLIKEGEIKKEKPLPPISEDEIPYDLPEGWIWCRFGEVISLTSGQHIEASAYNSIGDGVPYLTGPTDFGPKYTVISKWTTSPKVYANKGDILITVKGSGVGSINYLTQNAAIGRQLMAIKTIGVNKPYVFYFLMHYKTYYSNKKTGIAIPGISREDILETVFPLPPLAEQQRIVDKVDELLVLCDELEAAEQELNKLETHFVEYLPKAILQAAVQGKLVPQNIHDEPASELLERIQQEKARLIKEGKIKKEKPLPPISEDEIPYDLPDGWVWCRLGELITLSENNNIHRTLQPDEIVNYVDIDSVDNEKYIVKATKQLPVSRLSSRARRVLTKGSIIYSLVRPYLNNIAVIEEDKPNYIGSTGFVVFKTIQIPKKYFMTVLLSPYIAEYYLSLMSGFNSPSVSQDEFLRTPFPLPPLAEQQRIIAKLNELMELCNNLKSAYSMPVESRPSQSTAIESITETDSEPIELAMVARGDGKKLSAKAMEVIEGLFAEDK
jgi:type I restriction enzyme S subunit